MSFLETPKEVVSLPMRDGTLVGSRDCSLTSYTGGWKQLKEIERQKEAIQLLAYEDGNYKLLQNYLFWYFVVSLPMRDGNTTSGTSATVASLVVSLPMRDGNGVSQWRRLAPFPGC